MHERENQLMKRWKTFALLTTVSLLLTSSSCFNQFSISASEDKARMNDKMPECLKKLMTAKSLDDGVKGESPDFSKNHLAYAEASGMVSSLELDDLNYLLAHATPAGKLYAAVLLASSGRVGRNLSFEKLLNDKSVVNYQSGCRGTQSTVGEIARSFNDTGKYLNFQYSISCKLKAPVNPPVNPPAKSSLPNIKPDTAVETLLTAHCLDHYQQGDSNQPSGAWLAFQSLLQMGKDGKPFAERLVSAKTAPAKMYGVILLNQIDKSQGKAKLTSLLNDKTELIRSQGCVREQATVKDMAQRLLNGEDIVMMKDPNQIH